MCIRVFADGRWRRPQHPGRSAVGAGTGHLQKRPLRLPEPSGLLLLSQYHFRPVTTKIFTLGACRKTLVRRQLSRYTVSQELSGTGLPRSRC